MQSRVLTVRPHIRALVMGVREPGAGVREAVTGVMPAHLPAEQVCPATQHTCSVTHELAVGHCPIHH